MIGAIIGDMAGCRFERHAHQPGLDPLDFPLFSERTSFTDDTVLSFAVSEALMESKGDAQRMRDACSRRFKAFACRYPRAGYGRRFREWAFSKDTTPFGSFGNGSAMRVSPVGWSFGTLEETERMARAGSLAEVAAVLSGLFEAADETAQRYLHDIREQATGRSVMSLPDGEEKVS